MVAYAIRIEEKNFKAIASENPKFNMEATLEWLEQHGQGFFLRDPESTFDCGYFVDEIFSQMYLFESADTSTMFRRVLKI